LPSRSPNWLQRHRRTIIDPSRGSTSSQGVARLILRSLILAALVAFCCVPVATALQGTTTRTKVRVAEASSAKKPIPEYKIKAAFLYNFVRYTTWPDSVFEKKDTPIRVMIVGKDPFGDYLKQTFKGKLPHNRKVVLLHEEALPKEIDAHLVFTSGLDAKSRDKLLEMCANKPILLMGEEKGLAELGACGNFYLDKNKVRFEVNSDAVKQRKLTISSQLLKLARIVKSKGAKR
jgi:YfiR/HmsC-like